MNSFIFLGTIERRRKHAIGQRDVFPHHHVAGSDHAHPALFDGGDSQWRDESRLWGRGQRQPPLPNLYPVLV
ncbi:hypothetical protein LSTR_LSTR016749 [Laodelphax striatellus]|uniref:Uncharacterized protein n=1 Tax=Laodelphax striatellus TaxID=195883 RepID=A0A482WNN2_LAOST|nr:hypothetical protein LSTR_LSTR016749 [Laodelphax striatellus]